VKENRKHTNTIIAWGSRIIDKEKEDWVLPKGALIEETSRIKIYNSHNIQRIT
jgi:hypothetical protein